MVSLSQIQQAAKGGFVRLDSKGSVTTGGKGFKGRIVAWARKVVNGERVASNNRAAVGKFVEAIATDKRYGRELSRLADARLQRHAESGKPLRERVINHVLTDLDNIVTQRNSANQELAEHFSATTINTDDPHSLQAMQSIKEDILAAGAGGKHQVTTDEAQRIATTHLGKLADKLAMEQMLEASDLSVDDRAHLSEVFADDPIQGQEGASRANGRLLSELINNNEQMAQMKAQAGAQAGLGGRLGDFSLGDGQDVQMAAQVAEAFRTESPGKLVSREALKGALQAKLNDHATALKSLQDHAIKAELGADAKVALISFLAAEPSIKTTGDIDALVAARKPLLDHIDSYGNLGREAKAELGRIVLSDPRVNSAQDMDAIVAAMPACQRFCEAVSDPSLSLAAALVRYRDSGGRVPADKAGHAMALLGAETRSGRVHIRDTDLKDTWSRLAGQEGQQLNSGILWLGKQHPEVAGAEELGGEISDFMAETAKGLARQLSLEPDELAQQAEVPGNIEGEQDVPDDAYTLLRDLNLAVPLPNPMGRSQEGSFGERFNQRYEQGLNTELARKQTLRGGIDSDMYNDLGRATFSFGERVIRSYKNGTDKGEILAGLEEFFEGDEAGKLAVSRVTHQGLLASPSSAPLYGDGPLGVVPRPNHDRPAQQNYEVWRDGATGDYVIQVSYRQPVGGIVLPGQSGDEEQRTDPEQSEVSYNARFRITRTSIDHGQPTAELEGPVNYGYRFMPERS